MITLNDRIDILGKKYNIFQKKMENQKFNYRKDATDVISDATSEIKRMQKNLFLKLGKDKPKFYLKLFNANKSFDKIKTNIGCVKNRNLKKREREEAKLIIDYAEFTIDYAMIAIEEATLSFYNAVETVQDYINQYGDDVN
ncbi:MAG: hypothetical protein DBX47_03585 [Clostridiales bacterium]|nr:MAG: hypothetical protein DBX47_03585 [Clostridiales bacterium]